MEDLGDWRVNLKQEARDKTVQRISKHLQFYIPAENARSATVKFSRNFEVHCFNTASSETEYERKIQSEMDGLTKYDKLCEDNPFTDRKYEGFLGTIKFTYRSKTVSAPTDKLSKDPDDITLEQSAKTCLRRDNSLKEAVRKLLLQKALKKGKAESAIFNAAKGLHLRRTSELQRRSSEEDGSLLRSSGRSNRVADSTGQNAIPTIPGLTAVQKRTKIPRSQLNDDIENENVS